MAQQAVMMPSDDDPTAAALTAAIHRVGDRWTLRIVAVLLECPQRFTDLQRRLDGISPNVLSRRLADLEADGLAVAEPYQQRPPRYAYALTPRGRELSGPLRALAQWQAGDGDAAPRRHDACGTPVEVRWWCPTCDRPVTGETSHLHRL